MLPKKAQHKTSFGAECLYFSNSDGTGWKVYREKDTALKAWATQLYFHRYGMAAFIYSNVIPISIEVDNLESLCPARTVAVYFGFLTEEVRTDKPQDNLTDITNLLYEAVLLLLKQLQRMNNTQQGFDLHSSNIGISNDSNSFVIIDFGSHFYRCLSQSIQEKIGIIIKNNS